VFLCIDKEGVKNCYAVRTYAWEDENRLVLISDESASHTFRTAFVYDGFGRMRKRLEYTWVASPPPETNPPPPELESTLLLESSTALALGETMTQQSQPPPQAGTWQLGPQTWYSYDGFRVIQERDSCCELFCHYSFGRFGIRAR
jgi:hypothetical protein